MRTLATVLLAAAAGTGALQAAPAAPAKSNPPTMSDDADSLHVTVTAGRGRLGFAALQISPELRQHFGAPSDRGVLVNSVRPDSPAARAGVQAGDIIVEVDGRATSDVDDVLDAIADRKKGESVALRIIRAHKTLQVHATLAEDARGGTPPGFNWSFDTNRMPMELGGVFEDKELRRMVDDARKRIDELERRLRRLEKT